MKSNDSKGVNMLTVREFLILMKISMNTFRKWMKKGMPVIKQDGVIRIDEKEAITWLKDNQD
jgi:phage terminase Nu1 subunit (DNA packaging protein)